MAYTKTVKQVDYCVQITKTLSVPQWLMIDVRRTFLNDGKIAAIKALRSGFHDHYGESMSLLDAKNIVEDTVEEYGMETRHFSKFNASL